MSTYTVQHGDTPMLITQKLLGNPTRMQELVRSNAHKPTVAVSGGRGAVTFRDLQVGEQLTIPPRWDAGRNGSLGKGRGSSTSHHSASSKKKGSSKKHPSPLNRPIVGAHARPSQTGTGVSGHAYPQRPPHFAVRPRDSDGSASEVQPIMTISGRDGYPHAARVGRAGVFSGSGSVTGVGACCNGCATGGSCEGGECEGAACAVQMAPCSEPQAPPSIPGSTSFPVGFGQTAPTTTSSLTTVGDALSGWGAPLAVGVISLCAGFGLAYVISK